MKFKRILSIFLMLSVLIAVSSCSFLPVVSSSDKAETIIYDYLKNKYPDLAFEIKSYTQDTYTSGRYVFTVLCTTTSVEFTVYHSSFLTTDSYSVVCANSRMEESLFALLGEELCTMYVNSIQWVDQYADGSEGYRFRNMDLSKIPYPISEVSAIFRLGLKEDSYETEAEAVQAMKAVVSGFSNAGIALEKIVFQFTLGKDTVLLTTDAHTVQTAEEKDIEDFLVHIAEAQVSDEMVQISYGEGIKKAEYFLKDSDKDSDEEIDESTKIQQNLEKVE